MLRITITEMATEQRWTLEGRLVQPWVGELGANWKKRHRPQNGRTCTVDLSQITCIDNSGLRLLRGECHRLLAINACEPGAQQKERETPIQSAHEPKQWIGHRHF